MKVRRPERYATLARVRRHQEEQRAQVLARARRVVSGLEDQRGELESYRQRILEEAGRQASEPVAVRLRALYVFERHLGRLADDKDVEIEAGRHDADARRGEFEEAVKRRRIVERLIEKAEEDVHHRIRRREQRHHDEIAAIQFARESLRQRRENEADRYAEDPWNRGPGHRLFSSGARRSYGGDGPAQ
ncbi:MAG: flagellar FliJ family protein [Candidatus Hydrogenedentes bacterium]|nr:flagellar FliJ family protein [Candidatus Hydrogenedentota bacterium]